ncbi:hypothetical protein F4808DRAFT_220334 [Astrocystis sublimbata]|nr:hypothetical protein F4808DRAFT_220334 [Astrocystis sublimbata]
MNSSSFFWSSANIGASALIVYLNKLLLNSKDLKSLLLTVSCCNYALISLVALVATDLDLLSYRTLQLMIQTIPLALSSIAHVVLTNLSLRRSSLFVHQQGRAFVLPAVAMIECVLFGSTMSISGIVAITLLVVGALLRPVTPPLRGDSIGQFRPATVLHAMSPRFERGSLVIIAALVASASHSVVVKQCQQTYNGDPSSFLALQSLLSCLILVPFIPFFDDVAFLPKAVRSLGASIPVTGGLAYVITLSHHRMTAEMGLITTTVVGYAKQAILLCFAFFRDRESSSGELPGLVVTIAGIILYSVTLGI